MENKKQRIGRPPKYSDARGAIRSAGLTLFSERGFEATTVSDIAKLAGVPKANVLYYFSDKEELWKEAVDHHWEQVDAFYTANLPNPTPPTAEGLETFLMVYLEACCRFPPYVQLMNLEGHAETWRTKWLAEKHLKRHIDAAQGYFEKLVESKVIPPIDRLVFQTMLTGGGQLLIGQFQLWSDAIGSDVRTLEFRRKYAKAVVRMMQSH